MTYFAVDIEADGPIPGDYSMVALGAVRIDKGLKTTFYARLRPISKQWIPDALSVSGFTRKETEGFDDPAKVMKDFECWISANTRGRSIFVSDNNGFDWQFVNWYFHHFLQGNPFGYASMNLASLYKGAVRDTFKTFRHLRKTKPTHNPLDDARGNAEAFLSIVEQFEIRVWL